MPKLEDEVFTGTEPEWGDDISPEQFQRNVSRVFNYYNYHYSIAQLKKNFFRYMKEELKKGKEDIAKAKKVPEYLIGMPACTLCTAYYKGMPLNESNRAFILARLGLVLGHEEKTISSPTSGVSGPIPEFKQNPVLVELDRHLDDLIENPFEIPELRLFALMNNNGINNRTIKEVETWVTKYLNELLSDDPDLIEGYAFLKKRGKNNWIKHFEGLLKDVQQYRESLRSKRTRRKKAPSSKGKMVSKVQYLKESEEFKVSSISPERIIGARRLFLFNTKTRKLTDISGKLSIKGTTVQGMDDSLSRCKIIRKPDEALPIFQKKTERQVEKFWKTLSTKESEANGRIGKETIILRIFS